MAVMKSLTLNGVTYDIAAGGGSATTAKTVTLYGDKWISEDAYQHYQVIDLDNVTTKTRVEIQPTSELLQLLYLASFGLYVENIEGVIRVYAVGATPVGTDLTIQLTTTEVEVNIPEPTIPTKGMTFEAATKLETIKLLTTAPVTVEAWVKLDSEDKDPTDGRCGIIWGNYENLTKDGSYISFEVMSGGVPKLQRGYLDKDVNARKIEFNEVHLNTGEWTHVAITYDGSYGYCYVNGVLMQTVEAPADFNFAYHATNSNYSMVLGGDHRTGNNRYFRGEIASLAVYSDQRSDAEILSDFRNAPGKDNLIVRYDLSNVQNNKISDLSGNGYNININN